MNYTQSFSPITRLATLSTWCRLSRFEKRRYFRFWGAVTKKGKAISAWCQDMCCLRLWYEKNAQKGYAYFNLSLNTHQFSYHLEHSVFLCGWLNNNASSTEQNNSEFEFDMEKNLRNEGIFCFTLIPTISNRIGSVAFERGKSNIYLQSTRSVVAIFVK